MSYDMFIRQNDTRENYATLNFLELSFSETPQ